MTNLFASIYILLVTNWTDVTPAARGWVQNNDEIHWDATKSTTTRLLGHVRSNQMARVVFDGKTNDILLAEGKPFLEITREITPVTTYTTNETFKPYQEWTGLALTNLRGTSIVWPDIWKIKTP